jgi:hypothetical protein
MKTVHLPRAAVSILKAIDSGHFTRAALRLCAECQSLIQIPPSNSATGHPSVSG